MSQTLHPDNTAVYVDPLYKSMSRELQFHAEQRDVAVGNGLAIETTSGFFGFKSHAALIADGTCFVDRLDGETVDEDLAIERASTIGDGKLAPHAEMLVEILRDLYDEELNEDTALAKRLVRSVLSNCEPCDDCGPTFTGSAVLKVQDIEACQEVCARDDFEDFGFKSYPFASGHAFATANPDSSLDGHCIVNPEAALNVAAFLHYDALELIKQKRYCSGPLKS